MSEQAQEDKLISSIGQVFVKARHERGWSTADVARRLKLTTGVIAAIEADRYQDISHLVFTKGYLRAYAKLLALPLEPIMTEFNQLSITGGYQDQDEAIVQSFDGHPFFSMTWIKWSTSLILMLLVVGVGLGWHFQHKSTMMDTPDDIATGNLVTTSKDKKFQEPLETTLQIDLSKNKSQRELVLDGLNESA